LTRARYVGYTRGTFNHGDEALMWIIRDMLAPEIDVIFEGDDYELALLGGGTLINQSPWLIDEFRSCLDKAKSGFVFGTGVGDLDFWGNHFERWIPLLRRCSAVGVRGPESLRLLEEHGFRDAIICGDPYLWIRSPFERSAEPKLLGVNLGSTNNAVWGSTDGEIFNIVTESLRHLRDEGWNFRFFSVWDKDMPILTELAENLGLSQSVVIDVRDDSFQAYSLLNRCDLFLGEKLHANAMAAVAGVPFVAIEYQPKVRDFAASVAMEEWVLGTAHLDAEILKGKILALEAQKAQVSASLKLAVEEQRNKLVRFVKQVKEIILRGS